MAKIRKIGGKIMTLVSEAIRFGVGSEGAEIIEISKGEKRIIRLEQIPRTGKPRKSITTLNEIPN